ncbi:hypothetical protein D3C71_78520 [compost metagenome]
MNTPETYLVFSARAEMTKDVFAVVNSINLATGAYGDDTGLVKVAMNLAFLKPGFFCDEATIELHFNKPKTLEWVRGCVRAAETIATGIEPHVFMQTLRPVPMAENSMVRDHTLE